MRAATDHVGHVYPYIVGEQPLVARFVISNIVIGRRGATHRMRGHF